MTSRVSLVRGAGTGAAVWSLGLVGYGVAEAVTNTAVGLRLTPEVWAVVLAVYGVIGLAAGAAAGVALVGGRRAPAGGSVPLAMATFLGALFFAHVALPLNDRHLPWIFSPASLVVNGTLAAAAVLGGLRARRRLASRSGPLRAAAFATAVVCLGLFLAGAQYVDMFVAGSVGMSGLLGRYAALGVGCLGLHAIADRLLRRLGRGAGWEPVAVGSAAAAVLAAVGLAVGSAPTHGAPSTGGAERPNVLWIVLDTVRADHLSVYGYGRRTSPRLEELAAEGVVFEQAVSPCSWTIPSHFQMVTSRFASGKLKVLDPGFETAAELLRAQGYRTGAVLANFSLGRRSGFEQGFETFVDGPVMIFYLSAFEKLPIVKALLRVPFVSADAVLRWLHRKTFLEGVAARADAVNRHALRFVDAHPGEPFFLFLNYMDAHDAYDPPAAWRERFVSGVDPEIGFVRYQRDLGGTISSNQFVRDVVPRLTPRDWEGIVGLYDAEIAWLDDQVGRLLAALRARGLYDRTIVVVTADHGELMGEHGLANHFKALTEEEIHVPLLVRYPPALPGGRRVSTPVQLGDVLPTLAELLRLPAAPSMEGRSLLPLLAGAAPTPGGDEAFSYLVRAPDRRFPHTASGHLISLRSGSRKYVWSSTGQHAYYDLAADPAAERNAYADTPEVAAMAARLDAWRRQVGLEHLDGDEPVDRLTTERLRALGYVQ
jgi:arylsulfatase A-like enzyme